MFTEIEIKNLELGLKGFVGNLTLLYRFIEAILERKLTEDEIKFINTEYLGHK